MSLGDLMSYCSLLRVSMARPRFTCRRCIPARNQRHRTTMAPLSAKEISRRSSPPTCRLDEWMREVSSLTTQRVFSCLMKPSRGTSIHVYPLRFRIPEVYPAEVTAVVSFSDVCTYLTEGFVSAAALILQHCSPISFLPRPSFCSSSCQTKGFWNVLRCRWP